MPQFATRTLHFLRQRGFQLEPSEKFPLFQTRKKLFENFGLGNFEGTPEQDHALSVRLANLEKEKGVGISPENLQSFFNISKPAVSVTPAISTQTSFSSTPPLKTKKVL